MKKNSVDTWTIRCCLGRDERQYAVANLCNERHQKTPSAVVRQPPNKNFIDTLALALDRLASRAAPGYSNGSKATGIREVADRVA